MKKYKIGYTQGTFDMFHIGHLNLINRAKEYCDYLIVGVNSDKLVSEYKNKMPVVHENDRKEIIKNIKAVDDAVIVTTLDKMNALQQFSYNAIFIGDDWKGDERWQNTKVQLENYNVDVVFLPYTNGISSTILRSEKDTAVEEN